MEPLPSLNVHMLFKESHNKKISGAVSATWRLLSHIFWDERCVGASTCKTVMIIFITLCWCSRTHSFFPHCYLGPFPFQEILFHLILLNPKLIDLHTKISPAGRGEQPLRQDSCVCDAVIFSSIELCISTLP